MAVPTNTPGSQLAAIDNGQVLSADSLRAIVQLLARQAAREHIKTTDVASRSPKDGQVGN